MHYPVEWFTGPTDFRSNLHVAAGTGRFHGLENADIADLFREYARRLDRADDGTDWRAPDTTGDAPAAYVRRRIEDALVDDTEGYRRGEATLGAVLRLLADDLDPELSLTDVRRREFVRTIASCRQRGDHDIADQLVVQLERDFG